MVKRHLADPAVFRRHVLAEAERLHVIYRSLTKKPGFGDLQASMLARHPWLDRSVPPVDTLPLAPPDAGGGRRQRIAVALLAVAVGMAAARML